MALFTLHSFAGLVCHFGINASEIAGNVFLRPDEFVEVSESWVAFSEAMSSVEGVVSFNHDNECVKRVFAAVVSETAAAGNTAPGLGDYVANALDAIGITKERVSALIGAPCSCPERQAALNKLGAKYLGLPLGTSASPPEPPAP